MSEPTLKPDRAPVPAAAPFISFSAVTFAPPGREAPMEVRVSSPATGGALPVILLSHGHGASNFLASMRGYGPLVDFYASHGFLVIQPTHLDSKTLALEPDDLDGPLFLRSRAQDMHFLLDHLDEIEAAVPGLQGRLDRSRIAAVGHSLGGHTVAMLAGMRVRYEKTGEVVDLTEPRLKAAIMFSPPGDGADLADWARDNYPALKSTDFSSMALPSLVVTGEKDINTRFSERSDWRSDAYRLSPGPKCLLMLYGTEHILGGISGYDAKETSDEDPARVAAIQRLTWAYLRSALHPGDDAWRQVTEELAAASDAQGRVECKGGAAPG